MRKPVGSRRTHAYRSGGIVYDPAAHREFVTGFRKRKQERRNKAAKDIEAAEKQSRRDERKQRRDVLRRTADRARGLYATSSDDENEREKLTSDGRGRQREAGEPGDSGVRVSRVYEGANDRLVTTTVTPIETFADANFSLRLPKKRVESAARRSKKGASDSVDPDGPSSGHSDDHPSSLKTAVRKRTRSAAKKHSKAKRHSAIEKTRRARRDMKASKAKAT